MLAMAIVCATAMTQAATTKWTATTSSNIIYLPGTTETPGTTALSSGTAYLFCLSTADSATTATLYSQSDIVTAFKNGTDISTLDYQKDLTVSDGLIATTAFTSDDFATGKATKFFFAIVNDDNIYISAAVQKTSNGTTPQSLLYNPASSSAAALKDINDGYSSAGWYGTTSVPEPTSGLMLLLGVAGLALRRKRA